MLSDLDPEDLPEIASSPGGLLCMQHGTGVLQYGVEISAQSPYRPYLGAGACDGLHVCDEETVRDHLLVSEFVQCHVQMMVLGVTACVFVISGVKRSNVFIVYVNVPWCNLMLKRLQQVRTNFIIPQVSPQADFGDAFVGRKAFLQLTSQACAACKADLQLDSIQGMSTAVFLQ